MRRLILFRHAKAEPHGAKDDDIERELTEEGREAARGMGAWLDSNGIVPDLVICSTAVRTRQTWQEAKEAFDPQPPVIFTDVIYEATPELLFEIVHHADGEVRTLMLIGHNPGMESLTGMLAESAEPDVAERFEKKFPTAAIAVLDFEDLPWAALEQKQAWLFAFETPKHLGLKDG
jgi:phosphohistidine phosphatase